MVEHAYISGLQKRIHAYALEHGWWEMGVDNREIEELVVLIVGEVSELHEAYRRGKLDAGCDKIGPDGKPILTCFEDECADIVIRLLDMMAAHGEVVRPETHRLPEYLSFSRQCFALVDRIMDIAKFWDYADNKKATLHSNSTRGSFCSVVLSFVNLMCVVRGVDLWRSVEIKHEYNMSRPYRHGGLKA
jgi:hypothetical protein